MATRGTVLTLAALLAATLAVAPTLALPDPVDPIPGPSSTDAALVGRWTGTFDGEVPAISMALTRAGVVYFGGIEARDRDNVFFTQTPYEADGHRLLVAPYDSNAAVKDLAIPETMGDLFCSGLTLLGDGTLLVAGGSQWQDMMDPDYQGFVSGITGAWRFDPATKAWSSAGEMGFPRWYPTILTRSDGSAMALSGITHLAQPQTLDPEVESFDGTSWTHVASADNLLPMYPRVFTVPSGPWKGDLFYETSATLWGPFGEHPMEATWSLEQRLESDDMTWSVVGPSLLGARQHAATVMLPLSPEDDYRARILTFGGSIGRSVLATSLAEVTTLPLDAGEGVAHDLAAPLAHPRWHANGVLLPDGSVLAVGGGQYDNVYVHGQPVPAVLVAERYDPASDQWTQLAPMTVARMYHSSALLLPDGRVLVGGHVPLPVPWTAFRDNMPYQDQVVETRFEIYEPPYLHWGARPKITAAPATLSYGTEFSVQFSGPEIKDAILIHPGATTHVWDVNERAVELNLTYRSSNEVRLTAPPDADVAMKGDWLLFLRTEVPGKGLVPSPGVFVRLA